MTLAPRWWLVVSIPAAIVALLLWNLAEYAKWRKSVSVSLAAGSRIIYTARGPIEYALAGTCSSGAPAVLIAHGTPGGYDQGILIANYLISGATGNGRYCFIAPSRAGYLRTPIASSRSPEEQADDFAALLDSLNVARVAMLSFSGGGPSAIQFALRHADRCVGLVLLSSSMGFQHSWHGDARRERLAQAIRGRDGGGWMLFTYARYLPAAWLRAIYITPGAFEEDYLRALYPVASRSSGQANDDRQYQQKSINWIHLMHVPVLIVNGAEDEGLPEGDARFAADHVPGAELLVVPGGHLSLFTDTSLVARHIHNFFDRHLLR